MGIIVIMAAVAVKARRVRAYEAIVIVDFTSLAPYPIHERPYRAEVEGKREKREGDSIDPR
jgi:hypothetical protein